MAVARVGDAITDAREFAGEITLQVARERIVEVASAFKADGFNYLVDLSGVDYSKYAGHSGPRFGVSYTLYSFQKNNRVRLKVATDEATAIPSVTGNEHEICSPRRPSTSTRHMRHIPTGFIRSCQQNRGM